VGGGWLSLSAEWWLVRLSAGWLGVGEVVCWVWGFGSVACGVGGGGLCLNVWGPPPPPPPPCHPMNRDHPQNNDLRNLETLSVADIIILHL
jgi:hypothetical protein